MLYPYVHLCIKHWYIFVSSISQHKNIIYKIEHPVCNKFYVGQTKKKLLDRFLQHRNAFLKQNIYISNLATHCLNNNHLFPNIENIKLIKNIQKVQKMNIWENLNIYKHNNNNLLIKEQTQIKTKQDDLFKIINLLI